MSNDSFARLFDNSLAVKHSTVDPASALLNHVKNRGFIVGSVDELGNVSFAAKPVVHLTKNDAAKEANRLSALTPGKAFIYVQFAGGYLVPHITNAYVF